MKRTPLTPYLNCSSEVSTWDVAFDYLLYIVRVIPAGIVCKERKAFYLSTQSFHRRRCGAVTLRPHALLALCKRRSAQDGCRGTD